MVGQYPQCPVEHNSCTQYFVSRKFKFKFKLEMLLQPSLFALLLGLPNANDYRRSGSSLSPRRGYSAFPAKAVETGDENRDSVNFSAVLGV